MDMALLLVGITIIIFLIIIYVLVIYKNRAKDHEIEELKRNYESIDNYFIGSTYDFLLEKGESYFPEINEINENKVEAKINYKDNTSIHYIWEFGNLYKNQWGVYSIRTDWTFPRDLEVINVCISVVILPSEKKLVDKLYHDAIGKGYKLGKVHYRCALNNYSLGTCFQFGNNNSIIIKYHDDKKCYLGNEHALKMEMI